MTPEEELKQAQEKLEKLEIELKHQETLAKIKERENAIEKANQTIQATLAPKVELTPGEKALEGIDKSNYKTMYYREQMAKAMNLYAADYHGKLRKELDE